MKNASATKRQTKNAPRIFSWKALKPTAALVVIGIIAATYLKATIFIPRVDDDAAGTMFDTIDRETIQELDSIKDSKDAGCISIDFGKRTVDDKFVISLARVAYMGAKVRERVMTNRLETARIDLMEDIRDMVKDLGSCGKYHDCEEIEMAVKDNTQAMVITTKNGQELLAIQARARDFLTPRKSEPSVDEHAEFLLFLANAVKNPATMVKEWRDKPAFGDIARLQESTTALLRIHRDLYREYSTRHRVQEAIASMFSRTG